MTRRFSHLQLGVLIMAAVLAQSPSARAQIHFTTPVVPFEQALAAAKAAGKPLVVEFSAVWCGPCKLLARNLAKPRAAAVNELVHLVTYDGDAEDVGSALMNKLGYSSFPTLVAFDPDGKETSHWTGYGSWADFEQWLKELPEQAVSLATLRKSADASPKEAKLQLSSAARLIAAGRFTEARPYYERASKWGTPELAATAAWALLQLDAQARQWQQAILPAAQLVTQHPGSKEAGLALRFLAAMPNPPVAQLEGLLSKHLAKLKEASALNSLAYTAMKAGAFKAAQQIALRLEPLAEKEASYLNTLAEVAFYAEGNQEKAMRLGQRAGELATGSQRERYLADVERFRRNQKEPSEDLQSFTAPSLLPAPPNKRQAASPPAWQKTQKNLSRAIRDACWKQASGPLPSFKVIIATAAKASENRALYSAGTPTAWSECASKLIQSTEFPEGKLLTLEPALVALSWDEQLDTAVASAEDSCLAAAGGTARSISVALSGEAGKAVTLTFPLGKTASPELVGCVEKALAHLRPPRVLLQTLTLRFGND